MKIVLILIFVVVSADLGIYGQSIINDFDDPPMADNPFLRPPLNESPEHASARIELKDALRHVIFAVQLENKTIADLNRLQNKRFKSENDFNAIGALFVFDKEQRNDIEHLKATAEIKKRLMDYTDPCNELYLSSRNKKISDLTVQETQQVQACQSANLYPPPVRFVISKTESH